MRHVSSKWSPRRHGTDPGQAHAPGSGSAAAAPGVGVSNAAVSNADVSNADVSNADVSNADVSNADVSNADEGASRWRTSARWIPHLYLGFAAALVPWDVYLAISLPRRSISDHYRGTWVGFDLLLIAVLARIGWLALRRNPHMVLTASAGATLLITDAWFDVTTAASGAARTQALLSAVVLEIPAAVLCALLARWGLRVLVARAAAGSST